MDEPTCATRSKTVTSLEIPAENHPPHIFSAIHQFSSSGMFISTVDSVTRTMQEVTAVAWVNVPVQQNKEKKKMMMTWF